MTQNFDKFAARAAPAIFVLLWSTGFIGTKYVVNNADPLTYLAIRMAIVVMLMAVICAITRPAWPNRVEIGHSAVAGILVTPFSVAYLVVLYYELRARTEGYDLQQRAAQVASAE